MNVLEGVKPSYFDEIKDPRRPDGGSRRNGSIKLPAHAAWEPRAVVEVESRSILCPPSVAVAVIRARVQEQDLQPERITKYIAPTGASKTTLRHVP
jgi:hypothetical protein